MKSNPSVGGDEVGANCTIGNCNFSLKLCASETTDFKK